jgi:hypothetical protein
LVALNHEYLKPTALFLIDCYEIFSAALDLPYWLYFYEKNIFSHLACHKKAIVMLTERGSVNEH